MRLTIDLFNTRSDARRWKQSLSFGDYARGPFVEIVWFSDKAPPCDICGEKDAEHLYPFDDGGGDGHYCDDCWER